MASRIRSHMAQNEADRELHEHLAIALRAIDKAEASCGRVAHMRDNESRLSSGAARQYAMDIRRARSLLESIGTLVSRVDYDDPDLIPESTRSDIYRKKQEERKAEAAKKRQARGG